MSSDLTSWSTIDLLERTLEPDICREDVMGIYEEVARRNEYNPNEDGNYNGPRIVAEALAELVPQNRTDVKILDVGAGTGSLSEMLRTHGFENIDGLEPSNGMLMRAKERGLYKNYMCQHMSEEQLDIEKETYDAVIMSGAFMPAHMPCGALREMIRLLKKGGYCCFIIREWMLQDIEEYTHLEELIEQIQKEGKWEKIKRERKPKYVQDQHAILYCYRKL